MVARRDRRPPVAVREMAHRPAEQALAGRPTRQPLMTGSASFTSGGAGEPPVPARSANRRGWRTRSRAQRSAWRRDESREAAAGWTRYSPVSSGIPTPRQPRSASAIHRSQSS